VFCTDCIKNYCRDKVINNDNIGNITCPYNEGCVSTFEQVDIFDIFEDEP